jgi:hypothetical protein
MADVILRSADAPQARALIRSAVDKEISRLEKGIERALATLKQFEDQHRISSSEFAENFTAEDLTGRDLEYVEWMGEYRLFQQLVEDLSLLKSLIYVT